MQSYVIYFKVKDKILKKNHYLLNLNPRNPIGIIYLRKILKKLLTEQIKK